MRLQIAESPIKYAKRPQVHPHFQSPGKIVLFQAMPATQKSYADPTLYQTSGLRLKAVFPSPQCKIHHDPFQYKFCILQ